MLPAGGFHHPIRSIYSKVDAGFHAVQLKTVIVWGKQHKQNICTSVLHEITQAVQRTT